MSTYCSKFCIIHCGMRSCWLISSGTTTQDKFKHINIKIFIYSTECMYLDSTPSSLSISYVLEYTNI